MPQIYKAVEKWNGQKIGASEVGIRCEENVMWVGDKKYKLVKKRKKKVKNRKDADGKTLKCFDCDSEFHFARDPDCKKVKSGDGKERKKFILQFRFRKQL